MREALSNALVRAAKEDEKILLLTGDHGYSLFDQFRKICPAQYINAGVAEQNMVGVAAGLAKAGFKPIVYGLSAFVPIRVLEQIKLDVCYEQLPVIFIGDGAGVVYSQLGSSHQSTEDISALRAVPHIGILSPADAYEMSACMHLATSSNQPVYLRVGKADLGAVHDSVPSLNWGDLCLLKPGIGRMAFIATGSMVKTAVKVAEHWENSSVWSSPSIKPLNTDQVVRICQSHEVIVVMEEHSVYGGLGSVVTEIACLHAPTRICRIGIKDRFSQFCGSYEYLMKEHGLDKMSIIEEIQGLLHRQG